MFGMPKLTEKQAEVLDYITEYQSVCGLMPTYREIAEHFGFKSTRTVADYISALLKKGYLRPRSGRSRGIELVSFVKPSNLCAVSVPIMGAIPAGKPEELFEHVNGTLSIDQTLLQGAIRHRLFALKVSGNSMEGRGIYRGDWVVADADARPRENDMVVALVDNQNTLKTFAKKKGQYFLKAENPDHGDLTPLRELVIQGVVRAVLRGVN
jgi:repressor LexA